MNTPGLETEAKYIVPDAATFAALRQTGRVGDFELKPVGTRNVADRYLDTADKRFLQAGFACRIRTAGNRQVLTLKSLTPAEGGIHRRQEIETEIESDRPDTWPESQAKQMALEIAGPANLQTLFTLHQIRHKFHACVEGRPVIEFSLDEVSIDGETGEHYLELEAELIETGSETDLEQFTAALQSTWDLQPEHQSKFERGLAGIQQSEEVMAPKLTEVEKVVLNQIAGNVNKHLARRATIILMSASGLPPATIAGELELTTRTVQHWQREFNRRRLDIFPADLLGQIPEQVESAPPAAPKPPKPAIKKLKRKKRTPIEFPVRKQVGLEPTDTMAEAGRKVIGFHFARMLKHEPGTRLGEDIEALHDMRVATRRMRAAFSVFEDAYAKKKIKPLLQGLKATGRALGPVRDLDVFMEKLEKYRANLPEADRAGLEPLLKTWQAERETARDKMLAYLDSKTYYRFKQDFLTFVQTEGMAANPVPAGLPVPYQVRHIAPRLIYTRYEAVCAYDTILGNASLDTLHQLRLTFKQLRYTLEYFAELMGAEAKIVINDVKAMQDHLGDLNDADVASGILRDFLANWEQYQLHLPLTERQNPNYIVNYLTAKLDERHTLIVTFPEAWARFNRPEFKRNLALAVANI